MLSNEQNSPSSGSFGCRTLPARPDAPPESAGRRFHFQVSWHQVTAVMLQMTLGRFIRECRKKCGISLRALARLVEITPQFLSDIERGRARPSDGVLERIREELEIASNELDAFDSRVPWADLRELLDDSPEFRLVVRDAVRAWRAGQKPQDVARALRRGLNGLGR